LIYLDDRNRGSFIIETTSNKPVLSTGPCSAQVNSKRVGYVSKHIAMLYKLRKEKKLMNKVDVKDKN